jgi:hypothetical protein
MAFNDAGNFLLKERNRRLAEKLGLQKAEIEALECEREPPDFANLLNERAKQRRERLEACLAPRFLERVRKLGVTAEKVTALLPLAENGDEAAIEEKIAEFERKAEKEF